LREEIGKERKGLANSRVSKEDSIEDRVGKYSREEENEGANRQRTSRGAKNRREKRMSRTVR
jgi:hypothetical protein